MTDTSLARGLLHARPPGLDGRQSEKASEVCRGVLRLLAQHGVAGVTEVTLANGRRADVIGLAANGDVWVIEIKSCVEDFRADGKWTEYREFCDRLYFAVASDFPVDVLPRDTGLIVADRYGGDILRDAPEHRLAAARRKALTLRVARVAAMRLAGIVDPEAALGPTTRS